MSEIDRQRVAAVKKLRAMGYTFSGGEWKAPDVGAEFVPVGDGVYRMTVTNAEVLADRHGGDFREEADFLAWEWIGGRCATPPVADAIFRLLVQRMKELAVSNKARNSAWISSHDGSRELYAVGRAVEEFSNAWHLAEGWALGTSAEFGRHGLLHTARGRLLEVNGALQIAP